MANEVTLNIMEGFEPSKFSSFMIMRSSGYPSGNWSDLRSTFYKVMILDQVMPSKEYYKGRPFLPIAGKPLIKWSED